MQMREVMTSNSSSESVAQYIKTISRNMRAVHEKSMSHPVTSNAAENYNHSS